jgi:hypothetical protein
MRHVLDDSDQLTIVPWSDPVVERVGHAARGDYVEAFWLGVLGPTATWLLRRLSAVVHRYPAGAVIDRGELATSLGLGVDVGRFGALDRSLRRLEIFGLARRIDGSLAVRTTVPPLTVKQLSRLPHHLQIAHADWGNRPDVGCLDGFAREAVSASAC